ncbi:MAG: ABC transporter permease [Thermoleophilia bacterium]|nr:ABC transporter permease [Thermoleophilia bacterium]
MSATVPPIRARRAGFLMDVLTVAGRGLRAIPREPEAVIPSLVIGAFFYLVNVGTLQPLSEAARPAGFDYAAFQVPTAIIFSVTGVSRAALVVVDIQSGYFDRLLMTPVSRIALLLGLLISDFVLVIGLTIPVLIMGFIFGVTFTTGVLGVLAFMLIAGLWGIAFSGFTYAIALRTGSAAAVNSSFLLFFPFAFLTTALLPREQLTGALDTIAGWNPMTYLLAGLRALISDGWNVADLAGALMAIALVGAVSMSLALLALRSRVSRG